MKMHFIKPGILQGFFKHISTTLAIPVPTSYCTDPCQGLTLDSFHQSCKFGSQWPSLWHTYNALSIRKDTINAFYLILASHVNLSIMSPIL